MSSIASRRSGDRRKNPRGLGVKPTLEIDAVVSWVDGDDPAHRAQLNRLLSLGGTPSAARPTRFRSVGEIDYCITSLLKFAPFLRRVPVITDAQTPPIVERSRAWPQPLRDKLVLVDHRQVFGDLEDCLPTFNSLVIESVMFRALGLAEQFVYEADEMLRRDVFGWLARVVGPLSMGLSWLKRTP
jgi:hypothetical protein